MITRGKTCFKN